jgi:hypothetical protein
MVRQIESLAELSELESFGVHRLFAGLYLRTNRHLLDSFDTLPDPAFSYLAMIRFYELYERYVATPVLCNRSASVPQWRPYAALASRLTMTSRISAHLQLLSVGARAHTRYDLAEAICLGVADYRRLYGCDPDFRAARSDLLGGATDEAFFDATLEYIAMHRAARRGWRRFVLSFYARFARLSRPLWLPIFQSWRRAAWRDAMASLARPAHALAG